MGDVTELHPPAPDPDSVALASLYGLTVEKIQQLRGEACEQAVEHPLATAATELMLARSCLDVLHDVYALGDDALKESVAAGGLAGMLYDILCRVLRAEELVNSLPHV